MTAQKIIGVLLSIGGAVCFAVNSALQPATGQKTDVDTWWGIVMVIVAALFFAFWDTSFKHYSKRFRGGGHGHAISTFTFQAMLGFWTFALYWPVPLVSLLIKGWTPITYDIMWWLLILSAALMVNELGFVLSIAYSSPLYANMACLFVVPMSFVVDVIIQHYKATYMAIIGATCITAGFVFIQLDFGEMCCKKVRRHESQDVDGSPNENW